MVTSCASWNCGFAAPEASQTLLMSLISVSLMGMSAFVTAAMIRLQGSVERNGIQESCRVVGWGSSKLLFPIRIDNLDLRALTVFGIVVRLHNGVQEALVALLLFNSKQHSAETCLWRVSGPSGRNIQSKGFAEPPHFPANHCCHGPLGRTRQTTTQSTHRIRRRGEQCLMVDETDGGWIGRCPQASGISNFEVI